MPGRPARGYCQEMGESIIGMIKWATRLVNKLVIADRRCRFKKRGKSIVRSSGGADNRMTVVKPSPTPGSICCLLPYSPLFWGGLMEQVTLFRTRSTRQTQCKWRLRGREKKRSRSFLGGKVWS